MSDKVINLDDRRPHISAYVACLECGKDWVAVAPPDTLHFECPVCVKMSGVIVEPANPEFLNAFFRGAKSKKENLKRTMVVLNAQRMIDEGVFR
jgi:hypothetical protein